MLLLLFEFVHLVFPMHIAQGRKKPETLYFVQYIILYCPKFRVILTYYSKAIDFVFWITGMVYLQSLQHRQGSLWESTEAQGWWGSASCTWGWQQPGPRGQTGGQGSASASWFFPNRERGHYKEYLSLFSWWTNHSGPNIDKLKNFWICSPHSYLQHKHC